MEQNTIKSEIKQLLEMASPDIRVPTDDADLFDPDYHIASRDMIFVCMELKKKYPIDYNQVVDQVETYSLNNLASAICAQLA